MTTEKTVPKGEGSKSRHAPKRGDGLMAYVVRTSEFAGHRITERVEWAANLATAKREHGHTRMLYTSITVRRATVDDLPRLRSGSNDAAGGEA